LVGRPVTATEVGVDALGPYTPRLPDPTPVVPSQSWYCVAPVPAVHVKVADEPGSVVPCVGLVIAGKTVVVRGAVDLGTKVVGVFVAPNKENGKTQTKNSRKTTFRLLSWLMNEELCTRSWSGR